MIEEDNSVGKAIGALMELVEVHDVGAPIDSRTRLTVARCMLLQSKQLARLESVLIERNEIARESNDHLREIRSGLMDLEISTRGK